MKSQPTIVNLVLLMLGVLVSPMDLSAQEPGDGDCPICFADPENLNYQWCDTWIVGVEWCAGIGGVCTYGGELCEPETAPALTADGSDSEEYQLGWEEFPSVLRTEGVGLKSLVQQGRARLISCRGTTVLRAYSSNVLSKLKAEAAALSL